MGHQGRSGPDHNDAGYTVQTDYYGEPPALALVRAIAALKGCEMERLPNISPYLNLDALNRLMERAPSDEGDQHLTVEVTIDEYTAVVRDDGTITVHEDGSSANRQDS